MSTRNDIIKEALSQADKIQDNLVQRAKQELLEVFTPKITKTVKSVLSEMVSPGKDQPGGYDQDADQDALAYGSSKDSTAKKDDINKGGKGPQKLEGSIGSEEDEDELDEVAEEDELDETDALDVIPLDEEEDEDELDGVAEEDEDELDEVAEEDEDELDEKKEKVAKGKTKKVKDDDLTDLDSEIPTTDDEPLSTDDEGNGDDLTGDVDIEDKTDGDNGEDIEGAGELKRSLDKVKKENFRLQRENKEYKKAFSILHEKFSEVNLLNTKLTSAMRFLRTPGLTTGQKQKIVEAFDNAKTVREVKLISRTLSEGFKVASTVKKSKVPANIHSVSSKRLNEQYSPEVRRMNEMAGTI
jgi:hypothetical protein